MDIVSHHHAPLGLPLGGPVLPPGVPTPVKRWNIIKGHSVVKAWLQASVIEEVGTDAPMVSETPPEPSEGQESDPLADLRAEYYEKFGKRPYHGWDDETLKAKIDGVE